MFAKLTSLGEAISYECLSNSPQLCGIVPEIIEGTVEKFIVKHDVELGAYASCGWIPNDTDCAPSIHKSLGEVPIWVVRFFQNSVVKNLARGLVKRVYGKISLGDLPL